MRVVVVGLGGVGVMSAWALARRGHQVVGLEQFSLDHDRGSSYGDSRIVRRVYPDDLYTSLMAEAYALWDELRAASNNPDLFRPVGGLYVGAASNPKIEAARHALEAAGVPFEALDVGEMRRRFPAWVFRDNEAGVLEPSMGYARASGVVRAAAELARRLGAELREQCTVEAIAQSGGAVHVRTESGERFVADGVILSAGPWSGRTLERLGARLPLQVTRQPYVHLAIKGPAPDYEPPRFPVWIDADTEAYGFPKLGDLPGCKVGLHWDGSPTTADTVNRQVSEADRQRIRDYARSRFRGLGSEVVYEKVCLYTRTPDEHFIVDRLPGIDRSALVAGLSGHGFKFTPLLGRMAAELAVDGKLPPERFRMSRFV